MSITYAQINKILTPTQERFLRAFFDPPPPPEYVYLSGGTALAAFYLKHRYSDDLGLFTRSPEVSSALESRIERAAAAAGLEIQGANRAEAMLRLSLAGDPATDRRLEKIEVLFDPPPYFAPPQVIDGVNVDSLLAIAVNKMAIVTRDDLKDYVDLYFIFGQTPLRFEDLVPLAMRKLFGLDRWALADKFLRARRVSGLAGFQARYLVKPIDCDDLQRFCRESAERLLALFPPERTE